MKYSVLSRATGILASAVLVLGLMAPGLALARHDGTSQVHHTKPAGYMWTRDLRMGMTGADVLELQRTLNTSIDTRVAVVSAGSPGTETMYFGPLTYAATIKFQNIYRTSILTPIGLTQGTGYVGIQTRTMLNSLPTSLSGTPVDDDDDNNDNDTLRGGESSLEDYELNSEESSGSEGEDDVEIATAEFDVEDGDARIERIEIDFQAESTTDSTRPWDYFDTISIWADGKMLDEMDVDARGDWSERDDDSNHDASSADYYRLTFTGLRYVVDEGERAEITIAATIAGNIDSADMTQEFTILIPDRGIRATDSIGIQHYIGDYDDTVTGFGFDEEESGDIDIESSSDDPDSMTLISDDNDESDDYTVFVFDMENNENADALVTDLTIDVATSSGSSITSILDSATLVVGGDEFDGDINADGTIDFDDIDVEIAGDDTEEFELMVTLKRNAPDSTLVFSIDSADVEAEGVDSGDDSDVSGSAESEQHTVAVTGIMVDGVSTDARTNDDGTIGTFEITFTVEALEDDAYIYNGADNGDNDSTPFSEVASTTGVVYTIYQGGSASTTPFATDSAILQRVSNVDVVGNYYKIREGQTGTLRLTVTLDPAPGTPTALYYIELDAIRFDDEVGTAPAGGTSDDTLYLVPDEGEFQTGAKSITG